jgi:hypothetical protein
VLANVLHVAELARRYEADGGISFRGFIEELREQAEDGQAGEAPILEEGSDGVRLMTVHKAKGLEFPVVILADMTAKIRSTSASRYIDSERGACAIRIAGCSPFDLIQHEPEELARDEAEGVRLAYVAAPARAICWSCPPSATRRAKAGSTHSTRDLSAARNRDGMQVAAPGCPAFKSKDSVLMRPTAILPAEARLSRAYTFWYAFRPHATNAPHDPHAPYDPHHTAPSSGGIRATWSSTPNRRSGFAVPSSSSRMCVSGLCEAGPRRLHRVADSHRRCRRLTVAADRLRAQTVTQWSRQWMTTA